uniref:Uncharacterized protein n=3 Tax=Chenopodium quinoa TaxID=63459 RepID=A0A803N8W0_CHEQI
MDNRQFLPTDHKWRDNKSFNGKVEKRGPPRKLSSNEILEQLKDLEDMKFGKTMKLPKRDDNWKKKSTKSFGRTRQEIKKNGGKCSRVDVLVATRTRKSEKAVNAINLANNTHAVDEINKLKEQREQGLNEKTDEKIIQDVLGKDTHGYLKAHGPGRSITQHFKVKPSRIDLTQEVNEVIKKADQAIEDARKEVETARTEAEQAKIEAEQAKKRRKLLRMTWTEKLLIIMQFGRRSLVNFWIFLEQEVHQILMI